MPQARCAACDAQFDWNDAYKQQDTPGSGPFNPPGHGAFRPRVFCPQCGAMVAEWDIDDQRDNDRWKWCGENEIKNQGNDLPPDAITLWGKSISHPVEYHKDKLDLAELTAKADSEAFINAAADGELAVVEQQLAAGVDVNYINSYGWTAAMISADKGHLAVIRRLLEAEANINRQDVFGGHTPLYLAAMNGNREIVEVLMKAGADASLRNQFNLTASEMARNNDHTDLADYIMNYDASDATKPESQVEEIEDEVESTPHITSQHEEVTGNDADKSSMQNIPGYGQYVKSGRITRKTINICFTIGIFIFGWLSLYVFQRLGRPSLGWGVVIPIMVCGHLAYRFNPLFALLAVPVYIWAWVKANSILTSYEEFRSKSKLRRTQEKAKKSNKVAPQKTDTIEPIGFQGEEFDYFVSPRLHLHALKQEVATAEYGFQRGSALDQLATAVGQGLVDKSTAAQNSHSSACI
jgi:hypothetical protein